MILVGTSGASAAAPPPVVRRDRALVATSMVAAVASCAVDLVDRTAQHPFEHLHLPSRLLAAAFALSAGIAVWSALTDRSRRDPVRRDALRLLAWGLMLLWGGQAFGYVVASTSDLHFFGPIEQVPLLVSLPFVAVALLRLCWPSGMTSQDRRTALLDSLVAVLAFGVVWWLGVVPHWQYPDPAQETWERLDQVTMFLLGCSILVIAVLSRRMGSLPFPQLVLLVGGLAVQVAADALGQVLGFGDAESAITWSILGYSVAAGMVVAFAHRPPVEVETQRQRAAREFVSIAAPLAVVLPAGLLIVVAAWEAGEFDGAVGLLAAFTITALLVSTIAARVSSAYELRRVQESALAEVLAVRTREGWFRALVGDSADGVVVLDAAGRALYVSPRLQRDADLPEGTGWSFAEILVDSDEHDLALLLAQVSADPASSGPYDLMVRGRDGQELEMEAVVRPVADVEFQGFVLTARDVSDTRRLTRQLANSRRRDELTGLLSRDAFLSELSQRLDEQDADTGVAVVSLDLERFGALNDGLGHEIGDSILVAVAASFERLPEVVVSASRLGSDTFALLLVDDRPEQSVGEIVEQVRFELQGLLLADGRELEVGFHAGYVVSDALEGRSSQWHLEAADIALARARSSRNARIVGYDSSMRLETERRIAAERRLRTALAEDRVEVFYQPVVRLSDGVVTGAEALARLRGEDGAVIPPADFIALAEEIGLVGEIGGIVLEKAVAETARLSRLTGHPLHVAVNVATDQLVPGLVAQVADVLRRHDLPADRLSLEITESTLADRSERTRTVLADLRALGAVVSLDDFGTGYSSLSYLATLPVDGLKIDRSFVSVMGTSRQGLMLSRMVVQLARSLDLATVGEGVETVEQADLLRGMGCDYGQGYLYARPLPAAQYEEYLRGPVELLTLDQPT